MGDAGVYIHHILSAQHDLHGTLGRCEHIFHTDLQRPPYAILETALRYSYVTTCNGKFSSSYLVCVMLACIFIIFEVLSVIYIVG